MANPSDQEMLSRYTRMEISDYRESIRQTFLLGHELVSAANNPTVEKLLEQRLQMLDKASDADIARLKSYGADFNQLHEAMLSLREIVRVPAAADGRKRTPLSSGFPEADYSFCGSEHKGAAGLLAAQTVIIVAKGVWSLGDRGCDQVLVVLGEGGNTSLVCIIVDTVLTAAEAIYEGVTFCENDIDSAEINGSYRRLDHIHSDLQSLQGSSDSSQTAIVNNNNSNKTDIVSNNNSNKTDIVNAENSNRDTIIANDNADKNAIILNDNTNRDTIVGNDNANKIAIINNDNDNKNAIIANDNANKTAIVLNDNANRDTIVNNDNVNRSLIITNDNANRDAVIANHNTNRNLIIANDNTNRDLIISNALHLAIEQSLSSNSGTAMAFFELPAPNGYIDLARSIVRQTIDNMRAAGQNVFQAESFYTQALNALSSGQYKDAFHRLQQSYQEASK